MNDLNKEKIRKTFYTQIGTLRIELKTKNQVMAINTLAIKVVT